MNSPLFRSEALKANNSQYVGSILLTTPRLYPLLLFIVVSLGLILVGLCIFGSYTKKVAVTGQLLPDSGLVQLMPYQPGLVVAAHVHEGQLVAKDQVLMTLSSERHNPEGNTQAFVSQQIRLQLDSVNMRRRQANALLARETSTLRATLNSLNAQLQQVDARRLDLDSELHLALANAQRYRYLLHENFVSSEQYEERQNRVLQLKSSSSVLRSDRERLDQQRQNTLSELDKQPIEHTRHLAELDSETAVLRQRLAENEALRAMEIRAPEAGTVTAITARPGQWVLQEQPLLTLLPVSSQLQAELYVPSYSIGFVEVGAPVYLRLSAYPYQKFGQKLGHVSQIAQVALPSQELTKLSPYALQNGQPNGEPLYRITVALDSQFLDVYGKSRALQAGMLVQASLQQETRRIYQWVLEPLYSIKRAL